MWQKIKCWLGWHEWEKVPYTCTEEKRCAWFEDSGPIVCSWCNYNLKKCKHCGKVKK